MKSDDLASLISELLAGQEALVERIEALEHAQTQWSSGNATTGGGNSDGDDAADDLGEWVDWLIDTYHLDLVIPSNWADHAAIHAELDALHHQATPPLTATRPADGTNSPGTTTSPEPSTASTRPTSRVTPSVFAIANWMTD